MKHLIFLPVFIFLSFQLLSQDFDQTDMKKLSDHLYSLQFNNKGLSSFGALKRSDNEGLYGENRYLIIEPYFSHIGARGMLRSRHTDKFGYVLRWMDWYLKHIDQNGQMYNYYYKKDGTGETDCASDVIKNACKYVDAEDCVPPMFWILAYEYYQYCGDKTFFTPAVKAKMEGAANFLINNLMDTDKLFFAKQDYRIKYTMDNCEVYMGFLSLSKIEAEIYKDTKKGELFSNLASNIKSTVQNKLYNKTTKLYDFCLGESINPKQWYSGGGITVSQWPQLYNVDDRNSQRSKFQRQTLNENFDGKINPDWKSIDFVNKHVDDFCWPVIGYVFSGAGDTEKGFKQVGYITELYKSYPDGEKCILSELSWAIMNMSNRYPPKKRKSGS